MIVRQKEGVPIWNPGDKNRGIHKEDQIKKRRQQRGVPTTVAHLEELVNSKGKWELVDTNYHENHNFERTGEKLDEVNLNLLSNGLTIDMTIAGQRGRGRLMAHDVKERWMLGNRLQDKTLWMWQMTNGLSIRLVSGENWFIIHNKQAKIPAGSGAGSRADG